MFAPAFRIPRRLAFSSALLVALAFGLPNAAFAATAGPFEVSGSSYSWDGSTLTISGDDVVIEGMVDTGAEANVHVELGVTTLGIGSDVRIDVLRIDRTVRLVVSGTGNDVTFIQTVRGDAVGGSGSVTVETGGGPLDVYDSATVRIKREIADATIWQNATLMLGPEARVPGTIIVWGGVLDLSQVTPGRPIPVTGVSVGDSESVLAIAAPFGATDLHQLLHYKNLFVNDPTPVYENGEQIGTLNEDGSFNITATREVTFVGFDGAPLVAETVTLFGAADAPDVTAPDGYAFVGWDRTFDYVTENMTVTALFEPLPAPEPVPAAPSASGGSAPSSAASTSVPKSGYYPAPSKLAATGDGAGWALGAATAAGSFAIVVVAVVAAERRRG